MLAGENIQVSRLRDKIRELQEDKKNMELSFIATDKIPSFSKLKISTVEK